MKSDRLIAVIITGILLLSFSPVFSQDSPAYPFLGMWALTLDYEDNNAGWLEVIQEDGYLDAQILWRWASVYPVEYTMIFDGNLLLVRGRDVVRETDVAGKPVKTHHPVYWFDVRKESEDLISGSAVFPNGDGIEFETVAFTGKRIPPGGESPDLGKVKFGKPLELFNGRNLKGWELLDPKAINGWTAVDGVLVNDPVQKEGEEHINYGNLRTTGAFEDFRLSLEVNVPAGSNSGVYLRGIYEVQVQDSYGKALDPHNMGGLYSRITPSEAAEKPAGEWQEMVMTLCKRHLTVVLNGKTIIDNQPVKGVTGGALTSDEFSPGPLYLQGDHGAVSYRNIILTPIEK
ncbi:MAG: DUF1080 domain-containing protein [Bacteroidetes bacterium]|nr:DUF1080 domain-containing protein [Bacteroidota bacterium]